jgi:hypothetical protein
MVYLIPIGGSCFFGSTIRKHLNINKISYPFDFLRTNFKFIIDCIENDFINFLPNDCSNPQIINDLIIYNLDDHCFYHHDLRKNEMIESFRRKIIRFKNILEQCDEEVIFLRSISSKDLNNELNLRHIFFNLLNKLYPLLKFRIIFVGHRKDDDLLNINYEKIDDLSYIFTIGIKPIVIDNTTNFDINFQKNYDNIIKFVINQNYLLNINEKKVIINSDTLEYKETEINFEYNENSFSLDSYP